MNMPVTCCATFALVFFAYIFTQLFVDKPPQDGNENTRALLPWPLRYSYIFIAMFMVTAGPAMRRLYTRQNLEKMNKTIRMSNLHTTFDFIVTAQMLFAVVGGALGFFITVFASGDLIWGMVAGLVCLMVGWVLPFRLVENIAHSRQTAIVRELPFAIDLIAAAMRSGLDFGAAVNYYVANERKESILAQEFSILLRDIQLGKTRIEALEGMGERVLTDEFTSFVTAVIHGTEIGSPISQTIKIQGDEMRRRRFARAEAKAQRAPGAMLLPIALFIMPAFFIMIGAPLYLQFHQSGL